MPRDSRAIAWAWPWVSVFYPVLNATYSALYNTLLTSSRILRAQQWP